MIFLSHEIDYKHNLVYVSKRKWPNKGQYIAELSDCYIRIFDCFFNLNSSLIANPGMKIVFFVYWIYPSVSFVLLHNVNLTHDVQAIKGQAKLVSHGQTAFSLLCWVEGKRVWLPLHRNSVQQNCQKLASVNEALTSCKDLLMDDDLQMIPTMAPIVKTAVGFYVRYTNQPNKIHF